MYKESAMPDYPPVTESFAKFQAWMLENAPDVNFHPPANPAAIENFSAKSSLNLPEDLRQILLISDGETRKSAGAIGNWRLMPIAEIQAAWGWITRVTAIGAFSELKTQTSPYLNDAWWHPGWVPFVSNDAGDYFCIDTQPPEHVATAISCSSSRIVQNVPLLRPVWAPGSTHYPRPFCRHVYL
jgi:cell wall assembly regulator SMI1